MSVIYKSKRFTVGDSKHRGLSRVVQYKFA